MTPTDLLLRYTSGDSTAGEHLVDIIQRELDRFWDACREREDLSVVLHGPAWIDSIYLRHITTTSVRWHDRNEFYAITALELHDLLSAPQNRELAEEMDLVDEWKLTAGHRFPLRDFFRELDSTFIAKDGRDDVLKLRLYAGLSVEGMAQVLDRSAREIHQAWRSTRRYIRRHYCTDE